MTEGGPARRTLSLHSVNELVNIDILEPVFTLFLFLALLGVTAFAIRKWIVKRRRIPAQTSHSL